MLGSVALMALSLFFVSQLWMNQTAGSTPERFTGSVIGGVSEFSGAATVVAEEDNRSGILAALRDEVAARLGSFMPPVAVDEPGDEPAGDVVAAADEQPAGEIAVSWCDATVLESQFFARWPTAPVAIEATGAVRTVTITPPADSAASGTPAAVNLLTLPINPPQSASPYCLTHAYIGLTTDGRLIHNNDVVLYQGYGANELVGYAFDGNPIYGAQPVGTPTDRCGGSAGGNGYGYHVSSERDFILGCFVSEPKQTITVG